MTEETKVTEAEVQQALLKGLKTLSDTTNVKPEILDAITTYSQAYQRLRSVNN